MSTPKLSFEFDDKEDNVLDFIIKNNTIGLGNAGEYICASYDDKEKLVKYLSKVLAKLKS
jgi:hypothetical protein